MKTKTVYYAHCQSIYGTPQEDRDVALLESLGFYVENPSNPRTQEYFKGLKKKSEEDPKFPKSYYMRFFFELIEKCHALAFRALPDGLIPLGIYKEIEKAKTMGIPVFELPSSIIRRQMSLETTREYLAEVGQR